jgi:hypothetical protein
MKKKWFYIVPLAILALVLFTFIGGEVVLRLWNWLLPPLFGWRPITFWQAVGLIVLCRILFGGFGRHSSGRYNFRRRMSMEQRWGQRTPEERERFRQRLRDCFGIGASPSESKAQ